MCLNVISAEQSLLHGRHGIGCDWRGCFWGCILYIIILYLEQELGRVSGFPVGFTHCIVCRD